MTFAMCSKIVLVMCCVILILSGQVKPSSYGVHYAYTRTNPTKSPFSLRNNALGWHER